MWLKLKLVIFLKFCVNFLHLSSLFECKICPTQIFILIWHPDWPIIRLNWLKINNLSLFPHFFPNFQIRFWGIEPHGSLPDHGLSFPHPLRWVKCESLLAFIYRYDVLFWHHQRSLQTNVLSWAPNWHFWDHVLVFLNNWLKNHIVHKFWNTLFVV